MKITQDEKNMLISTYRKKIVEIWAGDLAELYSIPISELRVKVQDTERIINRIIELPNA